MTNEQPTVKGDEDSAAYLAGQRVGRLLRFFMIGFFTSVVGVVLGAGVAPQRFELAIIVASVAVGTLSAIGLAFTQKPIWAVFGAYVLLVGVGSVLQAQDPRPQRALVGIAVATIVAAVAGMVLALRIGRGSRDLERLLFSESTSVAFFVVMMSALTYGLLEAWLEAPKLSMWIVWSVGMFSWAILSNVFKRRYS